MQRVAKDLLGKVLVTRVNKSLTSGIIVETEAYSFRERGCHAYDYLRTARTEIMFLPGGHAYVYLCYGIHQLFNVVTNKVDKPEAVLIRALQPMIGEEMMMKRMAVEKLTRITSGPGKLTKALGIDRKLNGNSLLNDEVWIEDIGTKIVKKDIVATTRIGIDYAGEDAELPWRYYIKGNPWISKA